MDMGILWSAAVVILAAMALPLFALIIKGIFLVVGARLRPLSFPSCGRCAYDLTGSLGTTTDCPECGLPMAVTGVRPVPARRSPLRLVVGGVIVIAIVSLMTAHNGRVGWWLNRTLDYDGGLLFLLTATYALLFGLSGLRLMWIGWPRSRAFPSCGACKANVTESMARGACHACGVSFAETGVRPTNTTLRPRVVTVGAALTATAVAIVVFVGCAVYF